MYIEVFLLDNLLMNLLILRLGAALLSVRPPLYRQILIASFGAIYAALAAALFPILGSPWIKPLLLLVMALSMPFRDLRGFGTAALSTLISTLIVGGLVCCVALITEGGVKNGFIVGSIRLRTAMIGVLLASFLPVMARKIVRRSIEGQLLAKISLEHGGICRSFTAVVDTGNGLIEPITGYPVIVIHCPALKPIAKLPIPAVTPNGRTVMMGFIPKKLTVEGIPVAAAVALSDEKLTVDAILPAELAPTRRTNAA